MPKPELTVAEMINEWLDSGKEQAIALKRIADALERILRKLDETDTE